MPSAVTIDDVAAWAGISVRGAAVDNLLQQCLDATTTVISERLGSWVPGVVAPEPVTLITTAGGTNVGSWDWKTMADVGDPGSGKLSVDPTDGVLMCSLTTRDNVDATAALAAMVEGHEAFIQRETDATQWVVYLITGAWAVFTGWANVGVERVKTGTAGWAPRSNDRLTMIDFAPDTPTPADAWPPNVEQAVLIQSTRLYKRRSSPEGVAGFGDLGVIRVSSLDPDVEAMLGLDLAYHFG